CSTGSRPLPSSWSPGRSRSPSAPARDRRCDRPVMQVGQARPVQRTPDHWRWHDGPVDEGGPAVVFDMDGVLSDASRRQHFLDWPRRDWEAFFAACGDDALIDEVARLLDVLDDDLRIVLLTARPLRVRPQTLAWLHRYELRWDPAILRGHGD